MLITSYQFLINFFIAYIPIVVLAKMGTEVGPAPSAVWAETVMV